MRSFQRINFLKINRRPRDDLSDYDDDDKCDNESKIQITNGTQNNKVLESDNSLSIFLWLEYHSGEHYIGCLGQQSYTYASPNDIILAYNYNNMDKDWFLWLLNLNNLSPLQFIWIQNYDFPQFKHLKSNEYILKQLSFVIQQKLSQNPSLQVRLKPFLMIAETQDCIDKIKSTLISRSCSTSNIITCCAAKDWAEQFANKACLHRFIDNPDMPSLFEKAEVFDKEDKDGYGLGLRESRGMFAE